jgi:hypothetical protein
MYPHTVNVRTTDANCRADLPVTPGLSDYRVRTLTIRPGTTIVRSISNSGVSLAN